MSRQREFQQRMKAEGKCITCGKPREFGQANFCPFHLLKRLLNTNVQRVVKRYLSTGNPEPIADKVISLQANRKNHLV